MNYIDLLFIMQIIVILYNILVYRGELLIRHYNNETSENKNLLFINTNEMDDDWGQFVNIEMI